MKILALDSSTATTSLALFDGAVLSECNAEAEVERGRNMLGLLDELMAASGWTRASLEAIAFGAGPGSFTGTRLTCSLAQGLAYGLGIPALGVSGLRAMAHRVGRERGGAKVLSALDTGAGELYASLYLVSTGAMAIEVRELTVEAVMAPDHLAELLATLSSAKTSEVREWIAGDCCRTIDRIGGCRWADSGVRSPSAGDIARLAAPLLETGQGLDVMEILPRYPARAGGGSPWEKASAPRRG